MILVDPPAWARYGQLWSHLTSDHSFEELHMFAAELGLPARSFDGDHYDLPESMYQAAVAAGAVPVSGKELVARLVAAGLRRRKRH
ncbi:DUF4031 domain-containing protein [Phytoactinopolyspora alkaliphila]|uniref:DUF4031 domain-containing protein n=1 Tax=Phytoactinopolyspora alkaliphila TaxID=1783498 RepID=A0A6N9YL92_9ACTN|nr:DUF4031 domain-containing protein [Phytoactinopolyspora alkaliphila]